LAEALRVKMRDLEKNDAASREKIAALEKRLDDLDSEIIDESEGGADDDDDDDDLRLE
jgi:hypothetical protein